MLAGFSTTTSPMARSKAGNSRLIRQVKEKLKVVS